MGVSPSIVTIVWGYDPTIKDSKNFMFCTIFIVQYRTTFGFQAIIRLTNITLKCYFTVKLLSN